MIEYIKYHSLRYNSYFICISIDKIYGHLNSDSIFILPCGKIKHDIIKDINYHCMCSKNSINYKLF